MTSFLDKSYFPQPYLHNISLREADTASATLEAPNVGFSPLRHGTCNGILGAARTPGRSLRPLAIRQLPGTHTTDHPWPHPSLSRF